MLLIEDKYEFYKKKDMTDFHLILPFFRDTNWLSRCALRVTSCYPAVVIAKVTYFENTAKVHTFKKLNIRLKLKKKKSNNVDYFA